MTHHAVFVWERDREMWWPSFDVGLGKLGVAWGCGGSKRVGIWWPDGLHVWWGTRGIHLFWAKSRWQKRVTFDSTDDGEPPTYAEDPLGGSWS